MGVVNGFTVIPFTGAAKWAFGGALRDVSLKQARELAIGWGAVLREGRDSIKERDEQKREAMRNLHYLKNIALDAFESRKAELKRGGKAWIGFYPYAFIFSLN